MLKEEGVVHKVEDDAVWVQTIRQSTCNACHSRNGCGQKLINQHFSSKIADIRAKQRVDDLLSLTPGDRVEIGIAEGAIVAASLLVYGVPVLFMVLGAWLGGQFPSAFLNVMASFVGLGFGVLVARSVSRSRFRPQFFEPVVLRRLTDVSDIVISS